MAFFTTPTSYWRANMAMSWANSNATTIGALTSHSAHSQTIYNVLANSDTLRHSSHPDIGHLILLVFEAVLEVVCVSLPGYIVARMGMFDAEMQKFVANLNVTLFTPCLIFTKLASQLTADKLGELAVIPLIFAVQTLVSYLGSLAMAKLFGFRKRPRNFVIAMGVFGNSNSLPISLVISLSQTLKGLHWDRIPGDNDDEVAARGILYLLIFQQLGQLLRWSWGYNVLLAPPNRVEDEDEHISSRVEQGRGNYHDDSDIDEGDDQHNESQTQHEGQGASNGEVVKGAGTNSQTESEFDSGGHTPVTHQRYSSSLASEASSTDHAKPSPAHRLLVAPLNGNAMSGNGYSNRITSFPSIASSSYPTDDEIPEGPRGWPIRAKIGIHQVVSIGSTHVQNFLARSFRTFPGPVQKGLARCYAAVRRFLQGVWSFMNPPLWAMLAAIIVASVPSLQRLFFTEGTFINNSVTRAVGQSGGVAIPLILVVLGANLARNTLPSQADHPLDEDKEERKLLIASLISRMLLPIIVMGPLLALAAKYVPVSILDDPIFVVVCFLLTGAPSALQLAQICQINGVYMGAMSKLLFQSYVVWILPSTLILVMCALEVLEWAVE